MSYSPECLAAIAALELRFASEDVELVSIQHHAAWVERAEKAEAQRDAATLALAECRAAAEQARELRIALLLILDSADYQNGACRPNEMVGAVLPVEVLNRAHAALAAPRRAAAPEREAK